MTTVQKVSTILATMRSYNWSRRAIMLAVADAFSLDLSDFRALRHTTYIQSARSVASYLIRRTRLYSWSEIAWSVGFNDHTTAARAARTVPARLAHNAYLADLVRALEVRLGLPVSGQEQIRPLHGEGPTKGREP